MALRPAGVILINKNFTTYMNQQKQIKKSNQEAFNTKPLSLYSTMSKNVVKSMTGMANASNTLDNSVSKLRKTLADTGNTSSTSGNKFSNLKDKMSKLKGTFASGEGIVGKFGKVTQFAAQGGVANLTSGVGMLIRKIPLLGTALAALNLKQYIDQSTALAVRNETLGVTFDVVAARAGFTAKQADFARDSLKKTGITTAGATTQLQKMAQAGLDWGSAAKLARVAQDAAVIAGANSTAAFESMTWAIQTGSAEILDNFGIMVRFGKVYEEYAKTLGKSATALTEQEKLQSRMNAVLKQGEKISGTYTAALGTAGKMQGSLARVTEELSTNVGEVFLPFKTLQVELKTEFLKALLAASKGFKQLAAVSTVLVKAFKSSREIFSSVGSMFGKLGSQAFKLLGAVSPLAKGVSVLWDAIGDGPKKINKKGIEESVGLIERLGMGFQTWSRIVVESFAIAGAAVVAFRKELEGKLADAVIALGLLFKGDLFGAKQAFDRLKQSASKSFKETFKDELGKRLTEAKEQFPDLYTAWDELGAVAEVNMDKITTSIDESIAALENQKKALQVQQSAVAKAAKIYENFKNQSSAAFADLTKNIQKLEDDTRQSIQKAAVKRDAELAKLQDQSNKQREKLIGDHNKNRIKREKKVQKDLEKERHKFELSQLQSLRRFQLQETRLQAAGDVLAVKTLREDFALQRQEEKENFDSQNKDKKDGIKKQNKTDEKQLKDRLNELKDNIEKRRGELNESFNKEANDLAKGMVERRNQLLEDYNAQLAMLQKARNAQLLELGKSMRDQALITQEGMDNIIDVVSDAFGDDGSAMNLLKGWTDTSRTQTEIAMGQIRMQFEQLDKDITAMQTKRAEAITRNTQNFRSAARVSPGNRSPSTGRQRIGGVQMREGGSGVVEGPASFNVEPGVREAFMFAPVSRFSGDVNVRGRAGLDVTGMSQDASPGIERKIADAIMEEISIAIQRMSRRG